MVVHAVDSVTATMISLTGWTDAVALLSMCLAMVYGCFKTRSGPRMRAMFVTASLFYALLALMAALQAVRPEPEGSVLILIQTAAAFTGVVAGIVVWPALTQLYSQPSRRDLQKANSELMDALSVSASQRNAIAELNGELSRRVSELTEENEQLKMACQKADEAASTAREYIAKINNEVHSSLKRIVGSTELLLQNELPQEQKRLIENVNVSAEHSLRIVNSAPDQANAQSG